MVLISVFVALLLLRNFVVGFSHVIYADGRVDRGVIYKLEYKFRKPVVGEQVIFRAADNHSKRLAGFVTEIYEDVSIIDRKEIPGETFVTVKLGSKDVVVPLKDIEGRFFPLFSGDKGRRKA